MIEIIKNNSVWINHTFIKLDNKLSKTAIKSRNKIPYTTINGVHDDKSVDSISWWTNGFWGGLMWLMYNATGNEEYRKTAETSEQLLDKAFEDYKSLNHDVGFMWHLTSGANYRLTGNTKAYNKNLYVASVLMSRYNVNGEYIRAWNGEADIGWSIIDCMMNIPLLYWATNEIGDNRFMTVAMKHADMTVRDHIRTDGQVNHIVEHNPETGEFIMAHRGQGYSVDSCWARGLAWAVYGMALSYIHTKKKDYLDAAIKTADFFVSNISKYNYLTPLDFGMPEEDKYYDSTAGVCTACGLLEISKFVDNEKAKLYIETAINVLKATDEHFCNYEESEDSIVQMGTARYPHNNMNDLHIPIIYADFFFAEAILKLKGSDFLIW